MRMNDPSHWRLPGGAQVVAAMVASGHAIELTRHAPQWLGGRPVAVETGTYDRLVAWDTEAQRRHGVRLEEVNRLEQLFADCGIAAYGGGGCFISKAVDAQGLEARFERHVLTMTNYGATNEPIWLIHL